MNKLIRFIHAYLILGLPFIIVGMIWNTPPQINVFLKLMYELISFNFMFWFFVLTNFLFMLILMPTVREKTLRRLANINERDEREEYITGRASRTTYISSISLLIFLFFTSVFSINIYKLPENKAINGKHHFASMSLGYSLFEQQPQIQHDQNRTMIFDSQTFSLSKPSIILLLLCWQLLTFNFVSRKEQMKTLR